MYKLDEGKFVNHFGREVNNETPYYYVLSTRARDIKSVVLRVYVVRCHKLHPKDVHGSVDPYIEIRTNSTIISDSKNHIVKDTNPIFGRCYEVDARLPFDSILTVRVMDWDRLSSDFVGETVIDIENRFYSRHRARCGIQQIYNESGYNKWRANFKPTQILSKLCGRYNLEKPLYHGHSVTVANKTFTTAETENVQENAALTALRFWDKLPIIGCSFVKEHVETRSLYDPKYPGVEQGKIEMWLDILLNEPGVPLPPMVDISPRIPEPYELRVIVWSTSKVVMKDKSVTHGKMNTDIYIKSWMQGKQDMQKTDVHYNALKGEGLFNWRFIFNFAHVREEKMVIFNYDGLNTYGNQKVPPILIIQLWDCERFHPNEYLGTLSFDIHRIPLPIRETTKALNIDKHFMENSKTIDLLKIKYLRGWWPVMTNRPKYGNRNMVGLIELEFHLLTADEAESFPAGKGRNEPEALPVPLRPSVQWSLWVVPFRALWVYVFGYHKRTIIISLIIFAIALFILIFVYSFPQYSVKKLLNT
ncbi:hypothetical protein O3M35_002424 [Rhynocoris fuscipes]|uniref:C2 domain-containing protein n=1 Tax=Rhynocoris fuscipes TaxID=488301 RepID=A0AAW1CLU3_9HEMI